MQRLRTTFKRSRTPTGAEMKTQSSLEIPKQVRSASFDEIQLEAKRSLPISPPRQDDPGGSGDFLSVPSTSQRSRSFDSGPREEGSMFLEVPTGRKFQRRRSSGDKVPPYCIHCIFLEEYNRYRSSSDDSAESKASFRNSEPSSSDGEWASDEDSVSPQFCITVTPSPNSPVTSPKSTPLEEMSRRRSVILNKLERQEAFIFNEVPAEPPTFAPEPRPTESVIVNQFFLTVPELKRDRAASVDSCFLNKSSSGKAEEVVPQPTSGLLEPPPLGPVSLRSRSVDIVLPTDQQARYKALAMNSNSSTSSSQGPIFSASPAASPGGIDGASGSVGGPLRVTPEWGENAVDGEHLWVPTSASTDFCYCGDFECLVGKVSRQGSRLKCSACKVICHSVCLQPLEKLKFFCKPTFRDVGVRSYREQTSTKHHWVHRRQQKGKCRSCGKSFHSKLSFSSKEIVALSCSWCKEAFHNKETCFSSEKIEEDCTLGVHAQIIVPPAWIVKLPRKGNFKSSLRKSPKKKSSSKKRVKDRSESETSELEMGDVPSDKRSSEDSDRTFTLKPIPTANVTPLIVFINPKSGGNQGIKLLQKFQWLLNPRQIFDLTEGGPRMGLELFRKVPNLRVLACGGDGTVGWILSVIDQLNFNPPPAVGVLPLGTGNDLARALGWGGGYTDEPVCKILCNIRESDVSMLDRWELKVEKNPDVSSSSDEAKDNLPLNVVNNYFSLGVDAHIALEFHEAREAHPERFNSRLRNKMFYGQMGGKDLLRRKWKDLADFVTLSCDDKDMTSKLKENKFHAVVFLNIPSYGGGTHPWPKGSGSEASTDDGLIEVVGLSTYQLPFLQAGGHGTSICQCKTATITTSKPIPMQVDGEACKLNPSVIKLSLLNKAPMLSKKKDGRGMAPSQNVAEPVKISIYKINMADYEHHHYDKQLLKESAAIIGELEVSPVSDLEQVRVIINQILECKSTKDSCSPRLSPDWCYIDTCTAERFFRVDRAQEHLHYLTDIASEALYVLDPMVSSPDEATFSPTKCLGDNSNSDLRSSLESKMEASKLDEAIGETAVASYKPPESRKESSLEPGYISHLLEKTTGFILKAARDGDLKKLQELHRQGYSLLSIDSTGQTALHYSANYGFTDIVKYIIASAPQSIVDMVDNEEGQTALHKAAKNRRRSICCILIAGGSSLSIVDHHGNTPKLLALEANDRHLASYLESQEQFQLTSSEQETHLN